MIQLEDHDYLDMKAFYMICCIYIANRITTQQIVDFLKTANNLPQPKIINTALNKESQLSQTISHPEEENETYKIPITWISDMRSKSLADQTTIDTLLTQMIESDEKKKSNPGEQEKHSTGKTQGSPEAATDHKSVYLHCIHKLSKLSGKQANTVDDNSGFSVFMQHYTELVKNGECVQMHAQIREHFTAADDLDKVKKMEKNEENAKS